MTLVFESVQTEGIAQLSYLIGDDGSQTAAVIDPRPDVEIYLELSRKHGVAITHVFETHIHADFMSGARELERRLGSAEIFVSGEGDAEYEFPVQKIHDGDRFPFGSVVLTARHTPGHTPEHLAYELAEKDRGDDPWGVLTGDSLFVSSAGRPDLLGQEQTEELTKQLFHTLRDYYLKLDDGVLIYPCHGAGSACGADIGERPMSTIGYERRTNDFLQYEEFEAFETFVNRGAPPVPQHYPILKKINADGPPLIGIAPTIAGLPPEEFQKAVGRGESQLVDTRQMLAFGGGHIEGAINIGDRPELSVWAGDMLAHEKPILLVVEDEAQLDWIVWHFAYVGLTDFAGYLAGGMKAWGNKGLPLATLPQAPVHQLSEEKSKFQILDVRSPSEFESGRISGAKHKFVAEMRDGIDGDLGLDPDEPVAVYCGSGYRASIAASLMKRAGFKKVYNVPGSMQGWKNAGFTVVS
ncbi:MBL fold metallo-hydrolase [Allorhodopirellula solitaria]|uniref:Putative polyketide biosynthesis zinc-dependent hydrolase BaeB n=1 Tax=Allorhodopirellula solitaria TaxID=2527987 RepID=A0A5C5WPN9_9BACT|nr:MBL fold metallo-hydrolase [Allorhodopirellula solitaria]TWT52139.1 putative polyketide biosynthesis zinc-dependent hydrolase BaeB [Allorhodopirellula solitaria]